MGSCPLCGTRLPEGSQLEAHVAAELELLDGVEWTDVTPADSGRAPSADGNSRGEAACLAAPKSAACGSARSQRSHSAATREREGRSCLSRRESVRKGVSAAVVCHRNAAAEPTPREQRSGGEHRHRNSGPVCNGRRSRRADASTVRVIILTLLKCHHGLYCTSIANGVLCFCRLDSVIRSVFSSAELPKNLVLLSFTSAYTLFDLYQRC